MFSSHRPSISSIASRKPLWIRLNAIWLLALLLMGVLTQSSQAVSGEVPALALPGNLIISEFRFRGGSGNLDEFVEIYNNSATPHIVNSVDGSAGYALAASDGVARFVIPNGTEIPPYAHYLGVNSVAYSLSNYPAGNGTTAIGDNSYTMDIPDNAGLALFATSDPANFTLANRFDAVGSTSEANDLYKEGAGYPALTPFSIDHSFYRDLRGGTPKDTDDNAADFLFVDTNGTSAGAGQRLGAPGPENSTSPIIENIAEQLTISLLDPSVGASSAPNLFYDPTSDPANNSTFGTLSLRRTLTNNSDDPIERIRFRITDLTTFPSPSGIADLRPRTSNLVIVNVDGNLVVVQGTTLEQPPSQFNGGGFNSTLSLELGEPLAPGASIPVQFLFGVQQTGCERVQFDTLLYYDSCFIGATITQSEVTCDSFTAEGAGYAADGYAAMRVWNVTEGYLPLIDSYDDQGVPAVYAPISGGGTYAITATFPRQPGGTELQARIYRTPLAQFDAWDGGEFQDIYFTCNETRVYLPLIQH